MSKWRKKFESWQTVRSPQPKDEVEPLIHRVFQDRVLRGSGSHELQILVPELKDLPDYPIGILTVPIKSGQKIKPVYLNLAYEAANLLELYPPTEDDDDEESGETEQG